MNNDRLLARVFDRQEKKMIYPVNYASEEDRYGDKPSSMVSLEVANLPLIGITDSGIICDFGYDGIIFEKFGDRFIPMTCSGMKTRAKNKKLIYQGDILSGDPHGTVFVEFNQEYGLYECVWFEQDDDELGEPIVKKCTQLLGNSLNDCGDEWEVTGNRYQNEDLYKKILEGRA